MEKEEDERPFIELSRKERRDRARKMIFGDFKDEYLGNIWGWKFSTFSFIGLALVGAVAFYGIYTGKIDLNKLDKEEPASVLENPNPHLKEAAVKDTLKLQK
ncbi:MULTISPECIES: hypothetical protein [unclassified Aureispira]|uniref:hypothetical protein n=1 Tax=unclassified Aureispira TaxID=2649989 RepID=UPI00069720EF|nr:MULTISPECIES: hypothetical protein [unclassified Aureispira]WMX16404.1 hypothetical protein QP953_08495 [Aureispira sp. CCB-E]